MTRMFKPRTKDSSSLHLLDYMDNPHLVISVVIFSTSCWLP